MGRIGSWHFYSRVSSCVVWGTGGWRQVVGVVAGPCSFRTAAGSFADVGANGSEGASGSLDQRLAEGIVPGEAFDVFEASSFRRLALGAFELVTLRVVFVIVVLFVARASVAFVIFVVFFCFFLFFFEVAFLPEVVVEVVVGDGAGIDDNLSAGTGLEFSVAEIEGSGLEGVEEEAGHFGFELAGENEAHDLHEGDLDRVGVLEDGQGEGGIVGQLGVQLDALALPVFMEEAEAASAKSRGTALGAIGFEMSTTRYEDAIRHENDSTPSPAVLWNEQDASGRSSKSLR